MNMILPNRMIPPISKEERHIHLLPKPLLERPRLLPIHLPPPLIILTLTPRQLLHLMIPLQMPDHRLASSGSVGRTRLFFGDLITPGPWTDPPELMGVAAVDVLLAAGVGFAVPDAVRVWTEESVG